MKLQTRAKNDDGVTAREMANRETALKLAREGIVLLENKGVLPLEPGKIALYGAGAAKTIKGGTGSGEVNERHSTSILEGLEKAGFIVTSKKWLENYEVLFRECHDRYAAAARRKVGLFNLKAILDIMANPFMPPSGREIDDDDITSSQTDTCIYVVARQAGEAMDRKLEQGDYYLSETELRNIQICAERYQRTIVVINSGGTMDLGFLDTIPGIDALIFFCQQGTEGGTALAEIITGKVSPSGRLTSSWPMNYDDIPFAREYSYLNGNLDDEFYKEGIYVGYRFYDTFKVKPRYEFGYGLSYTDFSITCSPPRVEGTAMVIQAEVANTGAYPGKQVVQLYVSCPAGTLTKEYQRLAAFAKTRELKPGEKETLELSYDLTTLASYRAVKGEFILEPGDYVVRLGESSRKTRIIAVAALDREVIVSKHANICPPKPNIDELPAPAPPAAEDLSQVTRLTLAAEGFQTQVHQYAAPPVDKDVRVQELLAKLTLQDMVELVVGAGMDILPNKHYFTVPGAAGYTTAKLVGKGIIDISFSDGPAGLRLQKVSALSRGGKVKMVEAVIDFLNYLPSYLKHFIFGNPHKDTLIYQFTTAFPVGTAVAQTWNTSLAEEFGRAVAVEMKEYGTVFWLAPGMNIHRNPLCGRNFEYFSEDPLLTGKIAAAITRGVQENNGHYVTIKHFCANNQETNRNKVSSNLSERALREIYLRGFEIAVREGKAKGVMTSYNRVNGVYCANSHDLCTKVLRNEWGFQGVVMTDWTSCQKGQANSATAMEAGNDLIMPGSRFNKKEILKALKQGLIREEDVRRSAANILRSIVDSDLARELMP